MSKMSDRARRIRRRAAREERFQKLIADRCINKAAGSEVDQAWLDSQPGGESKEPKL